MPAKKKQKASGRSEFARRLGQLKESWGAADEGFSQIKPGLYLMQLQSAAVEESASSGRMQIHREHLVREGEMEGEVIHDYMQIETELGPRFVKQWINMMGFDVPDDPTELEEVVAAISDAAPIYRAKVTEKDGFTNVRIAKLLESGEEDEGPEPEEEEAEEAEEETEAEDEEEAEEEQGSGDELEEQLSKFCEDWNVEVGADDDESNVVNMVVGIQEYTWKAPELSEEEVALLRTLEEQYGITLFPEEVEEEEEEEEEKKPPKKSRSKVTRRQR